MNEGVEGSELPVGIELVPSSPSRLDARANCVMWSPTGETYAVLNSRKHAVEIRSCFDSSVESTIRFDRNDLTALTLNPRGGTLAIAFEGQLLLYDLAMGRPARSVALRSLRPMTNLSWSPNGDLIAASSEDGTIFIFKSASLELLHSIELIRLRGGKRNRRDEVCLGVSWSPDSASIATAGYGTWVLDVRRELSATHFDSGGLYATAWSPLAESGWLVGACADGTIRVWNAKTGREALVLEGHGTEVRHVQFSSDGRFLISSDFRGNVRMWGCETWGEVASFSCQGSIDALCVHPSEPYFATFEQVGPTDALMRIYGYHVQDLLVGRSPNESVTYTSAKIVLVGDSGAGKTGLGWRLAHGEFKEHASTHGQQFWMLEQLAMHREDGAECEAILWDLAGQPDYRLIHALFLDDVDLALILFDPTKAEDPLHGVEFWLKQLGTGARDGRPAPKSILVAARADRGTPRLTQDEIESFCQERNVSQYICTSALKGDGVQELVACMRLSIDWLEKPATVTTETFRRIKSFVLKLKENPRRRKVVFSSADLRRRMEALDPRATFSADDVVTAVGHLANHGYVTLLKTAGGEAAILLVPELLNNLAASFVLEARRNKKGLGSIEEKLLFEGGYNFSELDMVAAEERHLLVESAISLFLQHNVCFRETDPLNSRSYLVFPELINLKRPASQDDVRTDEGVSYTVSGAVENVYSSLVVLLGYTQTFTRTNQWRDHARYEVGNGLICGFRLEEERESELDFVLYYGSSVGESVRTLFQSLFESFLSRHNLAIRRFSPVTCASGHNLNRSVIRDQLDGGQAFAFCPRCGRKVTLPNSDKPIELSRVEAKAVEDQRRAADKRSRFEQVIYRLKAFASERRVASPTCFVSYAWGDEAQERWVEQFSGDLLNAGITIVLDRWDNAKVGSSIPRFVERVAEVDRVIVIGTPSYRRKYQNGDPMRAFVVAAEGDLIGTKMISSEKNKATVLPVLLEGEALEAFPDLLHGRVYANFTDREKYYENLVVLATQLYDIPRSEQILSELLGTLRKTSFD